MDQAPQSSDLVAPVWQPVRYGEPPAPRRDSVRVAQTTVVSPQVAPPTTVAPPPNPALAYPNQPISDPFVIESKQNSRFAGTRVQNKKVSGPPPSAIMIGDLLGSSAYIATLTVDHAFHTTGTIIAGAPGSPNSLIGFERDAMGFPNDFTSIPTTGRDATGDGNADSFLMTEPLPPNEVPTSPGPGFVYDGGTVVFSGPGGTTPQNGQYQDGDIWYAQYSFTQTIELPSGGGITVRRAKVAENNSPIPADRFYFDYKFFRNAPGRLSDVSRYTLGFEKTFNHYWGSIDIRIPYAYTLESEQFEGEDLMRGMEFGNLALVLKHIIWMNNCTLFSGGLGVSLPTGSDTRLSLSDGTQILVVENEAVHLQPFLAGLWTPTERFFLQSFLEVDFDVTGNPVRASLDGGRLPEIGKLKDPATVLADVGSGFWLYQNCNLRDTPIVRGVAVLSELHYTATIEDTAVVSGNGVTVTDRADRFNILNGTLGLHGIFFDHATVTGGLSFPLRKGTDREFDLEAAFLANLYF